MCNDKYRKNCSNCPFLYNDEYCLVDEDYMDVWSSRYKEVRKYIGISIDTIYKKT